MSVKNFKYNDFLTKYFIKNKSNHNFFFCIRNFYGINTHTAICIKKAVGISRKNNLNSVSPNNMILHKIYKFIKENLKFTLKQVKFLNVVNIKKIKSYKSYRHIYSMPVRGQRTRTNSNTRKKYSII